MTGHTIWHRRPEPDWCVTVHRDTDSPCNRDCSSSGPDTNHGVPLSLSQAADSGRLGSLLPTIDCDLIWGHREVDPRIVISADHSITEMTIGEAEQLLEVLAERIRLGRATQRGEDQ